MKPVMTTAAAVLVLLTGGCTRSGDGDAPVRVEASAQPSDHARAAQARIAGAFHASLVPRLEECWRGLQGEGEIEFRVTYRSRADQWVWQRQEVVGSSLPKGQDSSAARCMEEAARTVTFPLSALSGGGTADRARELVITWGWPVPFPADTSQMARMIDTGPGGGGECRKSCKDCAYSKETGKSFCASACSGYTDCREDGTGTGCQMTRPECATGWSGAWAGTFIARAPRVADDPGPASP